MIVSLPRSPWFYRCLNALLTLVLAWCLAGLLWQLFAPARIAPAAAPQKVQSGGPSLDVAPLTALFVPPADGPTAPSTLNYKLRGVIAAAGQAPAAAMFEVQGKPTLVARTGEEVESGVKLVEVAADHAIVDNRGRRERIDLDSKPAANIIGPATPPVADNKLISPVEAAPAAPAPTPAPALTPPVPVTPNVGQAPSVLVPPVVAPNASSSDEKIVAREVILAGGRGADISAWVEALANGKKGIVVVSTASQPALSALGLRPGDLLTAVNGSPLRQTGDISQLISVFARSPKAKLDVVRQGAPLTLNYRIVTQAKS
jgi:type II secretory pathway component PulC